MRIGPGVLDRTDFFRRPVERNAERPHKEWHHFVIHGHDRRIILNFSLCQETVEARIVGAVPRVILIAHVGDWLGTVERSDPEAMVVSPDGLDLRIGASRVRIDDGTYTVELDLPSIGATGRLAFQPRALPFVVGNHPIGPSGRLSWLLLPRLEAHGWLQLGGERLSFRADPAYHDHNWGHFRWGDDFGWEWGSALPTDPDDPWSVVFMRMTDRSRLRAMSQGLYLWYHDEMLGMFREATTTVSMSGFLEAKPIVTLPEVMAFLTPGRASGIPEELVVRGVKGADEVVLRFRPEQYVRVAIPSELDLRRVVTLNEISGEVEVDGTVADHQVHIRGSGVFELLT